MKVLMLTVTSMIYDSRIQKEARSLRDKGYGVTILYIEDQEFLASLKDPGKTWQDYQSSMKDIHTVRKFLRSRTWSFLPKSINKIFQAIELFIKFTLFIIGNKADIYHVHDLTPGIFGIFGKILFRGKLVYDAHELEVAAVNKKGLKIILKSLYETLIMKFSDTAITVNGYISEIMEERYRKKVHIIANLPQFVPKADLDPNFLHSLINLNCLHKE